MSMLDIIIIVIGTVATVVSTMVAGLRIELLASQYVAWIPQGVGAAAGIVIGVTIVARWIY